MRFLDEELEKKLSQYRYKIIGERFYYCDGWERMDIGCVRLDKPIDVTGKQYRNIYLFGTFQILENVK